MIRKNVRFLGLDPGLQRTGWGILEVKGGQTYAYIAHGVIATNSAEEIPNRLSYLFSELLKLIDTYNPNEVAIEEIFVNKNPLSSLKLGLARGVVLMAPAHRTLSLKEYPSTTVKKTLTGNGHAPKEQVAHMVHFFLPKAPFSIKQDATDALAIALCHAHHCPLQRFF